MQVDFNEGDKTATVSYLAPKTGRLEIEAKFKDTLLPGFPTRFVVSKDYSPDRLEISMVPDNNTFNEPYIALPLPNSLLVVDMKSHRIVEIDKERFEVLRLINKESGVDLRHPRSIARLSTGELVVVDCGNDRIVVLTAEGTWKRAFGMSGNKDGEFNKPRGVLVLGDDRILVCDTDNCRVQLFEPNGRHLKSVGVKGNGERQFLYPLNAAVSPSGEEIAITDSDNFRVQFFDVNLKYIGEIGKEEDPSRNKRKCKLLTPSGIAYDGAGNLIVSEMNGHCLRVFSAEKQLLSTIGSAGQYESGLFLKPRGVTVDEDGTIYVADTENKSIKMIHGVAGGEVVPQE